MERDVELVEHVFRYHGLLHGCNDWLPQDDIGEFFTLASNALPRSLAKRPVWSLGVQLRALPPGVHDVDVRLFRQRRIVRFTARVQGVPWTYQVEWAPEDSPRLDAAYTAERTEYSKQAAAYAEIGALSDALQHGARLT